MTPADLERLAARVEAEEPSYVLWKSALMLVKTGSPSVGWYDDPSYFRFVNLLSIGAYRDAAAMLMPEPCSMDIKSIGWDKVTVLLLTYGADAKQKAGSGIAEGPHAEARARLAAALRALASGGAS